jgi:hypothetical protein
MVQSSSATLPRIRIREGTIKKSLNPPPSGQRPPPPRSPPLNMTVDNMAVNADNMTIETTDYLLYDRIVRGTEQPCRIITIFDEDWAVVSQEGTRFDNGARFKGNIKLQRLYPVEISKA